MTMKKATERYDLQTGELSGEYASHSRKKLSQLKGVFADGTAFAAMDGEQLVYEVSAHMAVKEGTPGGLFFGTSTIHPGRVGNEYFMTKGHFHNKRECAEYYWGISGEGVLLLMDENRRCTAEQVQPGSLHYIGGYLAHRLINTGESDLVVGACWGSDAGHDYGSIETAGFSARVLCENGKAVLKESH